MYYTYVLKSKKNNEYYIGYTSNLKQRLAKHNSGEVKSTKLGRPWVIFYYEKFDNIKEVVRREKQIKSWKNRSMIEKLKFK